MAAFSQFASDLDKVTRDQLARGARLVEILKQGQYAPLPIERQVVIIYAGTRGYIDKIDIAHIAGYERGLYDFIEKKYPSIYENLRTKKTLDEQTEALFKKALEEFATAMPTAAEAKTGTGQA
jgi:F-type H+-transporting ATPase subunit alpha